MKAIARPTTRYAHSIEIRAHRLIADEPVQKGGADSGPNPQELLAAALASCTAITVEMYAERKGWELEGIEVECDYEQAGRGQPTEFTVTLRVPHALSDEQVERLGAIAAKCPVHRTLAGETRFDQRIERR